MTKGEIEDFVAWFWERAAQFEGQNPIVLHKGELEEGLEMWRQMAKDERKEES